MSDVARGLSAALADRYRIERELGAGGMATVYLADDLRHHRKVALKVMRAELATVIGADRFLSEITTTANLQHPHILALFDSGTVDGTVFYVMPFIEGESLRDRLDREKQLPIDEAVRIATEVAGALQYAHDHGVIHRDIKPENILLHGGHALVADFGIALAAVRTGGARITGTGMSLGTPMYMSPEQAMGERALDARTDIYALGCVLYEMLAGDPPHTGSTAQAIVAKVITEKPTSIIAHRDRVPAHVENAVLTALEKLPADRFSSAKQFADALGNRNYSTGSNAVRERRSNHPRLLTAAAVLLAIATVAAGAGWFGRGFMSGSAPAEPIRFAATMGRPGTDRPFLTISPDGRKIVQAVADSMGLFRLLLRDIGANTVSFVPGTEGAWDGAEFSPDGEWIAFVANATLRKVPVRGGPPTVLVDSLRAETNGIAWGVNGDLIFSVRNSGLWRLPAGGGAPVQLTRLDTARKEFAHWAPQFLPGERTIIYTNYATPLARSRIEAFDLKSGKVTVLAAGVVFGRYSPSGHLLYARDATLFAVAFDPSSLKTTGTAVPVENDVAWAATDARAAYALSPNGTLAFLRESQWNSEYTVVWRDRSGRDVEEIGTPGFYAEPRLSPNGRLIALAVTLPKRDVWVYDIGRRVLAQVTRAPAYAFNPVWFPDNRRLAYTYEDRLYELHVTSVDASEPDRVLVTSSFDKYASSISSDGRQLLFMESRSGDQLAIAPLDGSTAPKLLLESNLELRTPVFSPDGRWIAYTEHGETRADVYIRAADGKGGRRLVSAGGGMQPRFTKGGSEIVYVNGTSMMSVTIDPATGTAGTPVRLFGVADASIDPEGRTHSYDVTPSGDRFLLMRRIERPDHQPLVVVLNWRPQMDQRGGGTK